MKHCPCCNTDKPEAEFYPGHRRCKACGRAAANAYRAPRAVLPSPPAGSVSCRTCEHCAPITQDAFVWLNNCRANKLRKAVSTNAPRECRLHEVTA